MCHTLPPFIKACPHAFWSMFHACLQLYTATGITRAYPRDKSITIIIWIHSRICKSNSGLPYAYTTIGSKQVQVIYMHSLYYKIGGYITKGLCYHIIIQNSTIQNAFMTKSKLYNIHVLYVLYSIEDIHYHDSIICGLYIQHPKGMHVHDLESSFSLSVR